MTASTRFVLALASCAALLAASAASAQPRAGGGAPASWRGDARFLVAAIDSIHPRPDRWRHAALDSAADDLERRLPALRTDQAIAGLSRLMALMHDGHSRLGQLQLPAHGKPALADLPFAGFDAAYPVEFDVFDDGLWVVRATEAHADLLGARVVAINGRPVSDAVAALAPLIPSDNEMWTRYALPVFLRCPGFVSAAGLSDSPAAPLALILTDAKGRRRETRLASERPDSTARWKSADDDVRAPLPLIRRLPGTFGFADLGDSARTVFVRIRQIADVRGGETFARFVERLFMHVDSLGSRRLILDLRGNGGGNGYLNQPLVHAVIRHPALDRVGGLFVIVDRGTFSAAVMLSNDLQRETHARFAGEPTGGAPNSPGDPARVTLPGSGIEVRISTVMWNGSDPRDPRAFIAPDVPAPFSFADWRNHRDPALAAIDAWRPPAGEADAPPNQRWGSKTQIQAKAPPVAW
jgi:hypothetical protein